MSLPEFTGVAPRISGHSLSKYRGKYVTIVAQSLSMEQTGLLSATEVTSGMAIQVAGLTTTDLAMLNEFFVFVDEGGNLIYHSHSTFNDDFDIEAYKQLVTLIENHHHGLFY